MSGLFEVFIKADESAFGGHLDQPQTAPSPAPRPSGRWAPAPRTPPSSPWGSWCPGWAPWPGTTLRSPSFSPWGGWTELCREKVRTDWERWVIGPRAGRVGPTAAGSVRLTWLRCLVCLSFSLSASWTKLWKSVCGARRPAASHSARLKLKLCKWTHRAALLKILADLCPCAELERYNKTLKVMFLPSPVAPTRHFPPPLGDFWGVLPLVHMATTGAIPPPLCGFMGAVIPPPPAPLFLRTVRFGSPVTEPTLFGKLTQMERSPTAPSHFPRPKLHRNHRATHPPSRFLCWKSSMRFGRRLWIVLLVEKILRNAPPILPSINSRETPLQTPTLWSPLKPNQVMVLHLVQAKY